MAAATDEDVLRVDVDAIDIGDGDELNVVDAELTAVPLTLATKFGRRVKSLNLSENALRECGALRQFVRLETLIVDKNSLESLEMFPVMPTVHTLWVNNNRLKDLSGACDQLIERFPGLRRLSAMNNPATPQLICETEKDVAEAKRYRLYVLYRMPNLYLLDTTPVTAEERAEAKARGHFFEVRKPKKRTESEAKAPAEASVLDGFGASSDTVSAESLRKPAAFLGIGGNTYDGRHSEGNRFIGDSDL